MAWSRRFRRGGLAVIGLLAVALWPAPVEAAEAPNVAACERFEPRAMAAVPQRQQQAILGVSWRFCVAYLFPGDGPGHRFEIDLVDVDEERREEFRDAVVDTLLDPRGWGRGADMSLRPTAGDGDFRVVLASPDAVAAAAEGCSAHYSCRVGDTVWINVERWDHGTPSYSEAGESLDDYRRMVVNHEVGHWLGLGHENCSAKGEPAPVMQQQSKDLQGCEANPWPLPDERARLGE